MSRPGRSGSSANARGVIVRPCAGSSCQRAAIDAPERNCSRSHKRRENGDRLHLTHASDVRPSVVSARRRPGDRSHGRAQHNRRAAAPGTCETCSHYTDAKAPSGIPTGASEQRNLEGGY
jgi:hypothetical protein